MTDGRSRVSSSHSDRLIGVVDGIRRRVHGALGTRQWSVSVVTRRWSGVVRGDGTPSVTILDLDPDPRVEFGGQDKMSPTGRESSKRITLTGVSLRYTRAQLEPKTDAVTEIAYRLTDKRGQEQGLVWAVLVSSPIARRGDVAGDSSDWKITLSETSAMGPLDGVDA